MFTFGGFYTRWSDIEPKRPGLETREGLCVVFLCSLNLKFCTCFLSENFNFQHLSPDKEASPNGSLNEKGSPSVPRKRPSRSKPSYDPFLLVPCRKFPSLGAVPFDVHIQSETLVVMDTHAHMSTTEVIGLLGGHYSHDSRVLKASCQLCSLQT